MVQEKNISSITIGKNYINVNNSFSVKSKEIDEIFDSLEEMGIKFSTIEKLVIAIIFHSMR